MKRGSVSPSPTVVRTRKSCLDVFTDISNIAEQMIEKGLATVLRHKRDDEDRSAELDKLIVAEQT
jgi:endonuclease YncB( thermonuclease family)